MSIAETNQKVYSLIADRIIARLNEGEVPWRSPWRHVAENGRPIPPSNLISRKPYRGINFLMTFSQPYDSPYWLTFNQAKSIGGSVRKGEKATPIVFWKFLKRDERNADGETEEKRIPMLRYYSVFNAEQCDLPEGWQTKAFPKPAPHEEDEEFDPLAECEAIVSGYKGRPQIKNVRGNRAFYKPALDYIEMPYKKQFESREHYYATLFHELTHSTGHEARLNRESLRDAIYFGDRHAYSREELVAEFGATFLCALGGIENTAIEDNSVAYIRSWSKAIANDPKLIVQAAGQAQRAADLILGVTFDESNDEGDK